MHAPDHSLAAARRAFWLTFAATLALKVVARSLMERALGLNASGG